MDHGFILVGSSARADVELARQAEDAGFASVFAQDFFQRNSLVRAAAITQVTERVRIGTAISNAFTRSPLVLANAALDLDELSGGRFVLGLGSGTQRMNVDWFSMPFDRPAARMRELVRLVRAIHAVGEGTGFEWQGEFWQLKIPAYRRPSAARPSLPIWVAAVNRGMIKTAGRVADGLVGHPIHTRRWHREVTLPLLREAEREEGREPGACRLKPYVVTSIQPKRDDAVRDAKRQIGFYFTTSLYHSVLDLHGLRAVGEACRQALRTFDIEAMADAVPDALVEEIAVACTPDEARERLEPWRELTDEPLLYPPTAGVPPARFRANVEAIFGVFGGRG